MEKSVKKLVKTGYGLGLLSLNEAKKAATKVKKDFDLSDTESLKLAKALVANSEKLSKEVLGTAIKHFKNALKKSGVKNTKMKIAKKLVKKGMKTVKKQVKKGIK